MKIRQQFLWFAALAASTWVGACDSSDGVTALGDGDGDVSGDGDVVAGDGDVVAGDGDGDGDGTGGGTTGDGDGDGSGGMTGGDGDGDASGGQGGFGGFGGFGGSEPVELTLEDHCAARCATTVTLGCAGNTDVAACEEDCVGGAYAECEPEYEDLKECESTLMASGFQCTSFGPASFITLSDEGISDCETEKDAEDVCLD